MARKNLNVEKGKQGFQPTKDGIVSPTVAPTVGIPENVLSSLSEPTLDERYEKYTKVAEPAVGEVRRKAPPTLERGTPEWEEFERTVIRGNMPPGKSLAKTIASGVHEGQTDQIGVAYIDHPAGVVKLMQQRPEFANLSPREKNVAEQAAWLHDTLEDTALTADDLRKAGFSEEVIAVIDAVTAREGEPKPDYYERVKAAGPIAVCVKLGDLSHNNLPERRESLPGSPSNPVDPKDVGNPEVDRWTKLGKKYYLAYIALDAEVPEHLRQFAP